MKISPLLWLPNKPHLLDQKNYLSKMIWYLISVYITNRTLHGRLEIPNFSSRVEKNISLIRCAHSWNIFQHSKRNFVSPRGHVISSIYVDDDIDIGIDQDDKKKILIPWQSLISLLLRKCLERNKRAVPQDCSKQHANHWPREKYTANEIKNK